MNRAFLAQQRRQKVQVNVMVAIQVGTKTALVINVMTVLWVKGFFFE